MNLQFYDMQLEAIDDASKRSRGVLIVGTITSLVLIGATFNFGFGWLRTFTEHLAFGKDAKFDSNVVVEALQKQMVKNWVEQLFVNVPLLGLKFSIGDTNILGGLALTVISIWMIYSLRRENHLIGRVMRLAIPENKAIQAYVFYSICGTQVFGTLSANDDPIRSLNLHQGVRLIGLRALGSFLFYFPAFALLFLLINDVLGLVYFSAVFRGSFTTLHDFFVKEDKYTTLFIIKLIIPLSLGLVLTVLVSFLLWRAHCFHTGTIELLREAAEKGWGETTAGE